LIFDFFSIATSRDIGAILPHFPFFWQYAELRTNAVACATVFRTGASAKAEPAALGE